MPSVDWGKCLRFYSVPKPAPPPGISHRGGRPARPMPRLFVNGSPVSIGDLTNAMLDDLYSMGRIANGDFGSGGSDVNADDGQAPDDGLPWRCWVLTEVGAAALCDHFGSGEMEDEPLQMAGRLVAALVRLAQRPLWKTKPGELWWRGRLIKGFKSHADNQRCVLQAFQAVGWEDRIDDPLPPHGTKSRKQHLHTTIQALNRGQNPLRIRFRGDGTARGIRWEEHRTREK
jgi:hypothetical protein